MTKQRATIRQHYDRVQILIDGRLAADMPWQQALELSRAIHGQAKQAEAWAKASAIAKDQAILTRLGVPIGLSSDPRVIAEARKQAAWDRDLRRYIPQARAKGVGSAEIFGTPTITQGPPKETQ